MIVAVIAVRMVQVAVHQVIDMIAVRNCLVAAAGAVPVAFFVMAAVMTRRATGRVRAADCQGMLLDAAGSHVVQMPVVQVIDVAFVPDRRVTAARAVLMSVIGVMSSQGQPPFAAAEASGRTCGPADSSSPA